MTVRLTRGEFCLFHRIEQHFRRLRARNGEALIENKKWNAGDAEIARALFLGFDRWAARIGI